MLPSGLYWNIVVCPFPNEMLPWFQCQGSLILSCFSFFFCLCSCMHTSQLLSCLDIWSLTRYQDTRSYMYSRTVKLFDDLLLATFGDSSFLSRWGRGIWLAAWVRSFGLCLAWHHACVACAIGRLSPPGSQLQCSVVTALKQSVDQLTCRWVYLKLACIRSKHCFLRF